VLKLQKLNAAVPTPYTGPATLQVRWAPCCGTILDQWLFHRRPTVTGDHSHSYTPTQRSLSGRNTATVNHFRVTSGASYDLWAICSSGCQRYERFSSYLTPCFCRATGGGSQPTHLEHDHGIVPLRREFGATGFDGTPSCDRSFSFTGKKSLTRSHTATPATPCVSVAAVNTRPEPSRA